MRHPVLVLVILLHVAGCARYEISLREPAESAQTLTAEESAIEWEPVEYRFADLKNRLGVRIINHTDDPITLKGEESYVVDADGQTRAMAGGTIAPRSFIAFSVPPQVTYYRRPRSGITFGVGGGHFSRGGGFYGGGIGTGWNDDPWHGPGYETYRAWDWRTGEIRARFVLQQQDQAFTHDFVFDRVRVK